MADFKYEIVEHIGILSESAKGWTKELNRISWNGGEPKYDVWGWDVEAKGIVVNIISNGYLKVFNEIKNLIWQLYDIDA